MKNIRIATVGTNFIVDLFCDAVKRTSGAELVACYSRKKITGTAFAEKYCIPTAYDNYDEMLSDGTVDAVYVASPTFLHCEHTVRALRAGKHVLCEKSISTSYSEFTEMRSAAEKAERVLLEAMRPAHSPVFRALCESIHLVGKLDSAHFSFLKYSSRYDNFKRGIVENAFNPELKNSALSDIGVYPVWLAVALFGEPREVRAYSHRLSNGFDGEGAASLVYDDLSVRIDYSKITESGAPSFIKGDKGTLYLNKISEPSSLVFVDKNGREATVATDPCKNNMVYELDFFVRAVRGDASHLQFLDVSERLSRVMERIAQSQ